MKTVVISFSYIIDFKGGYSEGVSRYGHTEFEISEGEILSKDEIVEKAKGVAVEDISTPFGYRMRDITRIYVHNFARCEKLDYDTEFEYND